jgi:hypothetical protein
VLMCPKEVELLEKPLNMNCVEQPSFKRESW